MARWHGGRTKIQLKLAIQRTRMLQEKKASLAKRARREISDLVLRGKLDTARVKTESLIMDDVHIELLELLELYCETLYARFALLELPNTEPEVPVREPLLAVLHAAHRTEITELHALREMLAARYGPELAQDALENRDHCVSPRVSSKLAFCLPSRELVDAYLAEICNAYEVPLPGAPAPTASAAGAERPAASEPAATDAADGPAPQDASVPAAPPADAALPSDWATLLDRFEALKQRT